MRLLVLVQPLPSDTLYATLNCLHLHLRLREGEEEGKAGE